MLTLLDFGNSELAGLPGNVLNGLQSVITYYCMVRAIFAARNFEHITLCCVNSTELRVPQRIDLKHYALAFRCLHGMALPYLANQL